jgi:hypothetical protein
MKPSPPLLCRSELRRPYLTTAHSKCMPSHQGASQWPRQKKPQALAIGTSSRSEPCWPTRAGRFCQPFYGTLMSKAVP